MEHPNLTTVDERVRYIARLMQRDLWVRGKTQHAVAEAWGVAVVTVQGYAAQASRTLRFDPEERDGLRAALQAQARKARRIALRERNVVTGLRDIGAALKAIELEARLIGLDAETSAPERPAPPEIRIVTAPDAGDESKG